MHPHLHTKDNTGNFTPVPPPIFPIELPPRPSHDFERLTYHPSMRRSNERPRWMSRPRLLMEINGHVQFCQNGCQQMSPGAKIREDEIEPRKGQGEEQRDSGEVEGYWCEFMKWYTRTWFKISEWNWLGGCVQLCRAEEGGSSLQSGQKQPWIAKCVYLRRLQTLYGSIDGGSYCDVWCQGIGRSFRSSRHLVDTLKQGRNV